MDQELKQRLIGAAVITALAAIFIPMLFDDTVDDAGKEVNSLSIPELPAKLQEVEIAPLPEKAEDVIAEAPPTEKSIKPTEHVVQEGEPEIDVVPAKPKSRLSSPAVKLEKLPANAQAKHVPVDEDLGDDKEAMPAAEEANPVIKLPKSQPIATINTPATGMPVTSQKPVKPSKPAQTVAAPVVPKENGENPAKPVTTPNADANIRWYLNAGSFTQKANAQSLQEMLKQQGIASTLKEVTNEKGLVYKVRIGPMSDRLKAQAEKAKLTQLNITSFLAADE